jgi:hypothetical protein
MSDHTIAPGFSINEVRFTSAFVPSAGHARPEDWANTDPFRWRIVIGRFDPAKGGAPAFTSQCSFVPKGAPPGTTYGIKQIAFHKFLTMYYLGNADPNGSIVMATTSVNFAWHLDVTGSFTASSFAAPSLPFFLDHPIPVANGATGSIKVIDSPGGTARLVRTNLVTGKRNYLRSYASATDFITMLTVVMPMGQHVPVRGVMWKFAADATITWDANDKPTLSTNGRCLHNGEVDPELIKDDRLRLLRHNAFSPSDTILHKVNSGLMNAEIADAGALVAKGSRADRHFGGGTFEIVHSEKPQM